MIHLFTSYVNIVNDEAIKELYIDELIPQWVKVNSKYTDNITLVTDAPQLFKKIKNLKVQKISTSDAFCNYKNPEKKIFHHQVGCWKYFLDTIPYNDVAIYLDPDAFMIDDTLLLIADKVVDHQLSKKRFRYGDSDAGVSILRNTKNTMDMIRGVADLLQNNYLYNTEADCIIETYYDIYFKFKTDHFISWKDHTLCLRNQICGISDKINTIHGVYTESSDFLKKDEKKLLDIIRKKEVIRLY